RYLALTKTERAQTSPRPFQLDFSTRRTPSSSPPGTKILSVKLLSKGIAAQFLSYSSASAGLSSAIGEDICPFSHLSYSSNCPSSSRVRVTAEDGWETIFRFSLTKVSHESR